MSESESEFNECSKVLPDVTVQLRVAEVLLACNSRCLRNELVLHGVRGSQAPPLVQASTSAVLLE